MSLIKKIERINVEYFKTPEMSTTVDNVSVDIYLMGVKIYSYKRLYAPVKPSKD